jgi:hypothetical protein
MGFPTQTLNDPIKSLLNITTTTVVKNGAGFIFTIAAGAVAVNVYDSNVPTGNIAANLIDTIAANTTTTLNFPVTQGILITGAGPASVSFQ